MFNQRHADLAEFPRETTAAWGTNVTLAWYVAKRFALAFLRVFLIASLIVFIFQFVENIRKFADEAENIGKLVHLTVLQMPSSVNRMYPLVMLISSLTLFVGLARSSELVVTRAAGVSALKMVFVPVTLAVALGVLVTTVFNPIVATSNRQYEILEDEITRSNRSVFSVNEDGLWLRQAVNGRQSVIQARRASPEGAVLFDVEFHVFDQGGLLSERIVAATAELRDATWELSEVRRWSVDASKVDVVGPLITQDRARIPTELTVEQILNSFAPPETIPFWDLGAFIKRLETSGFSATRHRQYFQSSLATPALFAAMVLVGAGFTMRHARFGKLGIMVLTTVLSGFALYSFNNVVASLGAAGTIPVTLAAWAPSCSAVLLALALLLHLEDG